MRLHLLKLIKAIKFYKIGLKILICFSLFLSECFHLYLRKPAAAVNPPSFDVMHPCKKYRLSPQKKQKQNKYKKTLFYGRTNLPSRVGRLGLFFFFFFLIISGSKNDLKNTKIAKKI